MFRCLQLPLRRGYQWGLIMFVKVLTATALVALCATGASAASYTFDLQKIGSYHGSGDSGPLVGNTLEISQDGDEGALTGEFTGKYVTGAGYSADVLTGDDVFDADSVERHNNGLGVCNIGACDERGGDLFHTVDAATNAGETADFVELSFFQDAAPVDVTLTALTFGWIGSVYNDYPGTTGAFEILVSDLSETAIDLGALLTYSDTATINQAGIGGVGVSPLPDLAALTDNLFGIKAGAGGSWKLLAVTVDFDGVPEIPLPAAGWLLLGGLGSFAALRRAQKKR